MMKKRKPKIKYSPELTSALYLYFISYDLDGAPSIVKFARSVGATTEDIESLRKHKRFDRAYRECLQIRRDYLIDRALTRRFDPSFVKFLLSSDEDGCEGDSEFKLRLEVNE